MLALVQFAGVFVLLLSFLLVILFLASSSSSRFLELAFEVEARFFTKQCALKAVDGARETGGS
jgi:hypothetical protein